LQSPEVCDAVMERVPALEVTRTVNGVLGAELEKKFPALFGVSVIVEPFAPVMTILTPVEPFAPLQLVGS
jgi:hypothetical protein